MNVYVWCVKQLLGLAYTSQYHPVMTIQQQFCVHFNNLRKCSRSEWRDFQSFHQSILDGTHNYCYEMMKKMMKNFCKIVTLNATAHCGNPLNNTFYICTIGISFNDDRSTWWLTLYSLHTNKTFVCESSIEYKLRSSSIDYLCIATEKCCKK